MNKFNMFQASTQELLDYAVKKIVEQGERCQTNIGCVYGDGEGRHCAVGWLIPEDEEHYEYLMGCGGAVDELLCEESEQMSIELYEVLSENLALLDRLQVFHDSEDVGVREDSRLYISNSGVDTSGAHWQAWVDMAKENTE